MKLTYPVKNVHVTQRFGSNPKVYAQFGMKGHNGLDYRAKYVPIYASHSGKVSLGNQGSSGYGKYVRIYSPEGFQTIYAHLSVFSVKGGQSVSQGQIIGISGNTGFSTAAHLHFGLRPKNYKSNNGYGGYIDPTPYLGKENEVTHLEDLPQESLWKMLDTAGARKNGTSKQLEPNAKKDWLAAHGNMNINEIIHEMAYGKGLKDERYEVIDKSRECDDDKESTTVVKKIKELLRMN